MNQQAALGIMLCYALLVMACSKPMTPTLPVSDLQVTIFTVKPNPVERGEDVTIAWHVNGASQVTLWQLEYESKIGYWSRRHEPEVIGSEVGEWTVTVPFDATWQQTPDQDQPHWDVKFGNGAKVTLLM